MRTKAKAAAVFRRMQADPVYCEADKAGRGHMLCCNLAKWLAMVRRDKGSHPDGLSSMKLCTLHTNRYLASGRISQADSGTPLLL